ncbi:hypothetical protein MMJ53_12140 [Enterococcus cecorum]|uniref:hypothetical protein n=2 Tax=Enterococcus cecorum TaxID=44008 RepID=UPI00148D1331|nr:hypothetical protein [Enterococcus cecorum]MCJ0558877.1 hypothetical protein [Enterococcus cecorum]MCJ0563473.1 hypothetical protein [Enterococcus cecorum]
MQTMKRLVEEVEYYIDKTNQLTLIDNYEIMYHLLDNLGDLSRAIRSLTFSKDQQHTQSINVYIMNNAIGDMLYLLILLSRKKGCSFMFDTEIKDATDPLYHLVVLLEKIYANLDKDGWKEEQRWIAEIVGTLRQIATKYDFTLEECLSNRIDKF